MPEPFLPEYLDGRASPLAPSSPLEGEVAIHRQAGDGWREGGEPQTQSLPLTPLPIPPPQGGRGELLAAPPAKSLTLRQAFIEAARILRLAGIDTPELDARALLCHAAGLSHEAYVAKGRDGLAPATLARLDQAVARRLKREPVSRITGIREFYGRSFTVRPEALDPRPDTETLIEAALALVERRSWRDKPLELLDLGTGTGCILVTLLAELPQARGVGTDLSPGALALAAANAVRLGVGDRAAFVAADWLGIGGTYDLVLSNPPYLASGEIAGLAQEVASYDPMLALDGGADGLDAYRRIAAGAQAVLAERGRLLVEIGAGQAARVSAMFRAAGLKLDQAESIRRDLAGRPRVVVAGL
jgi:release factor glutamine methyltransferase